jgi:exoribonuclease II
MQTPPVPIYGVLAAVALLGCATVDTNSVLEADQARFQAMVANDLGALTVALADDLVYIHSDGAVDRFGGGRERPRGCLSEARRQRPSDHDSIHSGVSTRQRALAARVVAVDANGVICTTPHPAFGHPLPASRDEGLSR